MLLKVSSKTKPNKLAGAILHALRENGGSVELQAIGAGAVNQAVKAVAIARGMATPEEAELKVIPGFADIEAGEKQMTALRLKVFVVRRVEQKNT